MSRTFLFSGWLRRRPVETAETMDDLAGYMPRHLSGRADDWRPMHTVAAMRRRPQPSPSALHARPAGERPDLRIEKTEALDGLRIQQILAAGGAS